MKSPEFEQAEIFIKSLLKEKLSSLLLYHNVAHTQDVLEVAMKICMAEAIPAEEIELLRIAVLFHDAGFIHTIKNHEAKGCEMARTYLPDFSFSEKQIDVICGMIMSTKIPQCPKNKLEEIVADADLDYLGRDDVYANAQKLHDEMKLNSMLPDEKNWIPYQISFLKQHHFFTAYSRKYREGKKTEYLGELMAKLQTQQTPKT